MKKLLILFVFAAMAQFAFGQLDVKVRADGDDLVVSFPAGQTFEYKILLVDPIINGTIEMQFSKVKGGTAPAEIKWHADAGMQYRLTYRYPSASGEFSTWYQFDPMELIGAEKQ